MVILIGNEDFRGKMVASEVIIGSAKWLKQNLNNNKIVLGVRCDNFPAIRAYQKIGFILADTPHITKITDEVQTMVLSI